MNFVTYGVAVLLLGSLALSEAKLKEGDCEGLYIFFGCSLC